MNTDVTAKQLNRYVKLVKERWDDNAVEAVVGAMSTVISARLGRPKKREKGL